MKKIFLEGTFCLWIIRHMFHILNFKYSTTGFLQIAEDFLGTFIIFCLMFIFINACIYASVQIDIITLLKNKDKYLKLKKEKFSEEEIGLLLRREIGDKNILIKNSLDKSD